MRTPRSLATLALPVMAVTALAACGGGSGDGTVALAGLSPLDAIRTSAESSGDQAYRAEMTIDVAGQSIEMPFEVDADGQAAMSMDFGAMAGVDAEAMGLDAIRIVVDPVEGVFMDMGAMGAMLGGSEERPWMKVPVPEGTDPASMAGGASADALLDGLRRFDGEVTEEGTADVRGVATTHYRAEGRLGALAELNPGGQELPDELGALADNEVVIDVYIDADGLLRRMTMDMGDIEGMAASYAMDLFDYGDESIDVELPPADQVTELDPEMAEMFAGGIN
jgi:hypothetical protein